MTVKPTVTAACQWKGAPFPANRSDVDLLRLPCGARLHDACVWRGFMQNELGVDPERIWRELLEIPTWDADTPIPYRPRGDQPHWIPGGHQALRYRGNAVKRRKIWCQSDHSGGLRRYGYTGWQWRIAAATHDVEHVRPIGEVALALNAGLLMKHNHWITTCYETERENIGFHNDKAGDFAAGGGFVVLKLGEPRLFQFRMNHTSVDPEPEPFFSELLPAGTAVFCGSDANSIVQHGVPPMGAPCGPSGSIVGRRIATVIPWEEVRRRAERRRFQ